MMPHFEPKSTQTASAASPDQRGKRYTACGSSRTQQYPGKPSSAQQSQKDSSGMLPETLHTSPNDTEILGNPQQAPGHATQWYAAVHSGPAQQYVAVMLAERSITRTAVTSGLAQTCR